MNFEVLHRLLLFDFSDEVGVFYYLEAHYISTNDKAVLLSPTVSGSQSQDSWCFNFWYNMYGHGTGK